VHRGKVAEIIRRFEERGFKLVGIKVRAPACRVCKCAALATKPAIACNMAGD